MSKIEQGVSKAAARNLLAIAARGAKEDEAEQRKLTQSLDERLRRSISRYTKALEPQLAKHRSYAAYKKQLEELYQALGSETRTRGRTPRRPPAQSRRVRRILDEVAALNRKHKRMLKAAYEAVVDKRDYYTRVKGSLRPLGKLASFQQGELGTARFQLMPMGRAVSFQVVQPTPTTYEITRPYSEPPGTHETTGGIGGFAHAEADPEAGSYEIDAGSGIASGTSARAVVGDFITVPPGFSRLRVTARITVNQYYMQASAILAASWASADAIAEFVGLDNQVLRVIQPIEWVLAPLLWNETRSGTDVYFVNASFPVSDRGGEYMLRAGGQVASWGAGLGFGVSDQDGVADEILAELEE